MDIIKFRTLVVMNIHISWIYPSCNAFCMATVFWPHIMVGSFNFLPSTFVAIRNGATNFITKIQCLFVIICKKLQFIFTSRWIFVKIFDNASFFWILKMFVGGKYNFTHTSQRVIMPELSSCKIKYLS